MNPSFGSVRVKDTLTFGEVYPKIEEARQLTLPIVKYVVEHLNQSDIVKAEAVITDNIDEMAELITEKKVDVFIDTLHPLVYMKNQGVELKPILYRLKKNVKQASGVFIAHRDNDSIESINDLVGKRLVFKTVHATQAHLLARAYLIQNGYQLNYGMTHYSDEINCSFTDEYIDIENMVINGDVDAGTTSSHRIESLVEDHRRKIRIIGRTPEHPYHLVSIASHLPVEIAEQIKNILVKMSTDPAARRILARYYRTTGFEVLPKEVVRSVWDLANYCDPALHRNEVSEAIKRRKGTIVLGKVTTSPNKHYKRLKPMVDYAANQLKALGITRGEVMFARDNEEMIRYLKHGRVDWVTESFFSAMMFCEKANTQILAQTRKGGVADYHTIIFVRKDSGIKTLEDLKGRKIAFEDPGSTTSYIVPMIELQKSGLETVELKGPKDRLNAQRVGFIFSGSELSITTWVHKGLSDAGAFSNLDWDNPLRCPPVFKKDLRIIHRTRDLPRALEIVRNDLNPDLKNRLKTILLISEHDPKAVAALKAYSKTSGFDEFSIDANDAEYFLSELKEKKERAD